MAPLAQTLALLAMAGVVTAAMDTLPLDTAQNSFDDQYLQCSDEMSESLPELQSSDFLENPKFAKSWSEAKAEWQMRGSDPSPLTTDQAVALMVHSMMGMNLYEEFSMAVREAGNSRWQYQNKFHFKSLHLLLTQALQKLRPDKCQNVYRRVWGHHFEVKKDNDVRFGYFTPTSVLRKDVTYSVAHNTEFKVYTCQGADIQKFSYDPWHEEVLIPPFETFKVTNVRKKGNTMYIELHSTGNSSNYDCEWLKGRSLTSNSPHLPRNSPHLRGLLLATVAMAVITGIL